VQCNYLKFDFVLDIVNIKYFCYFKIIKINRLMVTTILLLDSNLSNLETLDNILFHIKLLYVGKQGWIIGIKGSFVLSYTFFLTSSIKYFYSKVLKVHVLGEMVFFLITIFIFKS